MEEAEKQTNGIFLWCALAGWGGHIKEDNLTQTGRVREYFLDKAVLRLHLGL